MRERRGVPTSSAESRGVCDDTRKKESRPLVRLAGERISIAFAEKVNGELLAALVLAGSSL